MAPPPVNAHRAYLDHASTAPLRPAAAAAIRSWLDDGPVHGDPGRIHHEGMASRHAVELAREQVAALLGARAREVVFTSGATESIAAATFGRADPRRWRGARGPGRGGALGRPAVGRAG